MKHRIVVSLVDSRQRIGQWTVDRAFTIQGLTSRRRTKAEQMRPGDKIVHYVTGIKAFAEVATITSGYFEDSEPIWVSGNAKRAGEEYPFGVRIEPDVALAREDGVRQHVARGALDAGVPGERAPHPRGGLPVDPGGDRFGRVTDPATTCDQSF